MQTQRQFRSDVLQRKYEEELKQQAKKQKRRRRKMKRKINALLIFYLILYSLMVALVYTGISPLISDIPEMSFFSLLTAYLLGIVVSLASIRCAKRQLKDTNRLWINHNLFFLIFSLFHHSRTDTEWPKWSFCTRPRINGFC